MDHDPACYWIAKGGDEATRCSCGVYALLHTPLVVGLRAQGHLPTIERMLGEGASWSDIGRAIGWHGPTAREWYERETTATPAQQQEGEQHG
jgi:hypothetical protein